MAVSHDWRRENLVFSSCFTCFCSSLASFSVAERRGWLYLGTTFLYLKTLVFLVIWTSSQIRFSYGRKCEKNSRSAHLLTGLGFDPSPLGLLSSFRPVVLGTIAPTPPLGGLRDPAWAVCTQATGEGEIPSTGECHGGGAPASAMAGYSRQTL